MEAAGAGLQGLMRAGGKVAVEENPTARARAAVSEILRPDDGGTAGGTRVRHRPRSVPVRFLPVLP